MEIHLNNNIDRSTLFTYTLHLADNALLLGQRNSEWCGHGPVLEQDIALTNISLDLLGRARNFYQYAATLYNDFDKEEKAAVDFLIPHIWKGYNRELTEDDLAFLREEKQYLNLLVAELPNGDWGQTILRQFFFSAFQYYQYEELINSINAQVSAIAEKSLKEVTYHLRWSSEWVIRLGDGTEESHQRMEKALQELWMFTGELFVPADYELKAAKEGFGADVASLKNKWQLKVESVFTEAGLILPDKMGHQHGGKEGRHTEYLGYILTDMQYLQQTYPDVTW